MYDQESSDLDWLMAYPF
uniref:Uncharacterized protein n=1 Tax=Arundo donax TaxID=35708 RepID=A0A0A8ZTD8_ARUDO